jgi:hypothetical protein
MQVRIEIDLTLIVKTLLSFLLTYIPEIESTSSTNEEKNNGFLNGLIEEEGHRYL